jgi:hypothetical protein
VSLLSAALVVSAGIAMLVVRAQSLPLGPEVIAWDREACAHCHMHIGEPRFAAQLQTRDGRIVNFDDPGCLLSFVVERAPAVHAIYFHSYERDEWLRASDVGFVRRDPTPMGFGLVAVSRGTSGAMTYSQALDRVRTRGARREAVR